MLPYPQQLLIRLYYTPQENTLTNINDFSTGLITAAGLLISLLLDNRVRLHQNQFQVTDPRPTHDDLLDEALARLASLGTVVPEDPEWFQQIVDRLPLGNRLFESLINDGLIYRQEKKGMFGLSKGVTYPFRDPSLPLTLFESERAVMLHNGRPDPKTAATVFMATCWGAPRPWKLTRQEEQQYDRRYQTLFGADWGWYGLGGPLEPIPGLPPDLRETLAAVIISCATIYAA